MRVDVLVTLLATTVMDDPPLCQQRCIEPKCMSSWVGLSIYTKR